MNVDDPGSHALLRRDGVALAARIADETIALLKDTAGTLPLDPARPTVLVSMGTANTDATGDWVVPEVPQ